MEGTSSSFGTSGIPPLFYPSAASAPPPEAFEEPKQQETFNKVWASSQISTVSSKDDKNSREEEHPSMEYMTVKGQEDIQKAQTSNCEISLKEQDESTNLLKDGHDRGKKDTLTSYGSASKVTVTEHVDEEDQRPGMPAVSPRKQGYKVFVPNRVDSNSKMKITAPVRQPRERTGERLRGRRRETSRYCVFSLLHPLNHHRPSDDARHHDLEEWWFGIP